LRPQPPQRRRDLAEFRRYTQSWQRPAAEEPEAGFVPWASDEGPPSWSVPPHRVAKAAARIDAAAGEAMHDALFDAYFRRSRDITDDRVLQDLWSGVGLDPARFVERDDPELSRRIGAEFEEALANGANGAPAVRMDGAWGVLLGAQPIEVYRRWIEKVGRNNW
jgi:predicted DsbA family dithiol-disulfide isomerase